MQEIFNKKFDVFNSFVFKSENANNTAGVLLFKEYLKIMNKWYANIDIIEKWGTIFRTDTSHNLVYLIAPQLLESVISLEDFKKNLIVDKRFDTSRKGLDVPILYAYLCWEVFKNDPSFNHFINLPNPYEPVIKILTRGNHIVRGEMATIEIDVTPIFKDLDFSKIFLPSCDDLFLNYIDEVCQRSGSRGIPNQEKTSQLWEEFKNQNHN
ncbi:hypothetical protein [Flavobacterium sp. JAS]|uniref:hypothetical protein n=1 Tax=Flavobacterium sp. JAS TaxID=2897329 RepID=UPI001E60C65B|nr:hypothetical protein [Flavobacterium sp. JAS]MCD0470487.1 hypothetical protein [Flavobacterium sp. JAS]